MTDGPEPNKTYPGGRLAVGWRACFAHALSAVGYAAQLSSLLSPEAPRDGVFPLFLPFSLQIPANGKINKKKMNSVNQAISTKK